MNDEDEELMDLWMTGVFDEDKKSAGSKGGGCLGCVLLMIAVPVIMIAGMIYML